MRGCLRFAVVVALSIPVAAASQDTQERPTFRSGVQYIEVDVRVTDKDGRPVRDLTADDFTLLEDGKPQPITTFSFIDLPIETRESRKAAVGTVESDVQTNTDEGRMYVMLIGRNRANPLRARLVARRFVEEAVAPNDQVAVIHACGTMSAAQGFTASRHLMLAAVDRVLVGAEGELDGEGGRSGCPYDSTVGGFEVFEEVARRLGLINGRRKVVVWFDPPSVFHGPAAERFAQRDALRAATQNNVAIYVVSTQGLTTTLGNLQWKAGLRVLADDTGGDVIVDSNNFSGGYERFVRDNSTYYLLGYAPVIDHGDGTFHEINVRVSRRGLTVRARRGYYAPERDAAFASTPPIVQGLSEATAQALRLPSSVGELGVELFAAPFKGSDGKGSVLLGVQLRGGDMVLGSGEPIEIAYQAMTTEGKITPGKFHVLKLDFTSESRASIEQAGVRVVGRLELPKGRHQVRFAVHQPNGKTGLVLADVEIPDYTKEPLLLSGIVLASERTASERTLLSDEVMTAILGSDPTARRRFSRDDMVRAFVEVYTNVRRVTEEVQVSATLTAADGANTTIAIGESVTNDPERAGYTVHLPLAALASGEYVLTIRARAGDHDASRSLLLTVGL